MAKTTSANSADSSDRSANSADEPMANELLTDSDGKPEMFDEDGKELDPSANDLADPPKDETGVTGGKYADPDPNPAFHNQEEVPGNVDPNADLAAHTAFEEGTPVGGHVV